MFDKIVWYFRNLRIDNDFTKYNKRCRSKHIQHASRLFSVNELQTEKSKLVRKISEESDNLYTIEMSTLQAKKSKISSEIQYNQNIRSFLERNYKEELNLLYKKKQRLYDDIQPNYDQIAEIKEEIKSLYSYKKAAYGELNTYKDLIDNWYSKSERSTWLLGNKGNKIPNHSFFGQSHGDLESYKYHRDEAYSNAQGYNDDIIHAKKKVGELYNFINCIKEDINNTKEQINTVKAERQKMFDYKKKGYNKKELLTKMKNLSTYMSDTNALIVKVKIKENDFKVMKSHQYGVYNLEKKINHILGKKKIFLDDFELKENRLKRIKEHREIWLKNHKIIDNE